MPAWRCLEGHDTVLDSDVIGAEQALIRDGPHRSGALEERRGTGQDV